MPNPERDGTKQMPEDPNLLPETDDVELETETKPAEPVVETPPAVDYEKKFAESTRENQILRERLAAEERARQESIKEPTDSDLRAAFPEWDTLTDFEKRMARDTFEAKRLAGTAVATTRQLQQEREWNTSVEIAVSSDPALQGKEHEFRQFASKPQYRGVPMDVLTAAFLQKNGATSGAAPKPTPKPGLETGTGGPKTPERPKLLSADELRALRKSDEKAYTAYIKQHPNVLDDEI